MKATPNPLMSTHELCDALLAQARVAMRKGDWSQALARLEECLPHMERHIYAEEAVLFPYVAAAAPDLEPALAQCQHEHAEILAWLKSAVASARDRDSAGGSIVLAQLMGLLAYHRRTEERLIYAHAPKLDSGLLTVLESATETENAAPAHRLA